MRKNIDEIYEKNFNWVYFYVKRIIGNAGNNEYIWKIKCNINSIVEFGEGNYYYDFENLNYDKLVFEVLRIKSNKVDGFNVRLMEK